jgi:hypothetical protein
MDHMRYCAGQDRSRVTEMVFNQIAAVKNVGSCGEIMYAIANSDDRNEAIDELVSGLKPFSGYSREDSRIYMMQIMNEELQRYETMVGPHPNDGLAHYSGSWNPWYMITSTFAHGDLGHILFNLIFWIAFAATVEALIGAPMFVIVFLTIALFTGVFNIVAAMATGVDFRTVGLSGVVTGMIGLYADRTVCLLIAARPDSLLLLFRRDLRLDRRTRLGTCALVHRRRHLPPVRFRK